MDGLTIYGRGFETYKGSRKLDWMTGIGSFELNLELDGVQATIAVSPAHAAVLMPFTRKGFFNIKLVEFEHSISQFSENSIKLAFSDNKVDRKCACHR